MSHSLRYRKAEICDHLASQYVAGVMTPRVRRRMESLIATTPELDRVVGFWSDQFGQLHQRMPQARTASVAPAQLTSMWHDIEVCIDVSPKVSATTLAWWDTLFFWRVTSAAGALASLVLAIMLLLPVTSQLPDQPNSVTNVAAGPSYLAAMSKHQGSSDDIHFVISAYSKSASEPSRLQVQWSEDHAPDTGQSLHLWAEDKISGQLSYIGVEPSSGQPWHLIKTSWQAIANSRRLIMTSDNQSPSSKNIVFSGPCVQLKAWRKSTS